MSATLEASVAKTKSLLREARKSPLLDDPGHMTFVRKGKHCLIGQVMSDLGVSDVQLASPLFDPWAYGKEVGLDQATLLLAMTLFDGLTSVNWKERNAASLDQLLAEPEAVTA